MSTSPASPPPNSPAGGAPKPPLTGAGVVCIVLGLLLAIPSGACTGIAFIGMLVDGASDVEEFLSIMAMVLLFAGLPLAGGTVLVAVGLRMRKAAA